MVIETTQRCGVNWRQIRRDDRRATTSFGGASSAYSDENARHGGFKVLVLLDRHRSCAEMAQRRRRSQGQRSRATRQRPVLHSVRSSVHFVLKSSLSCLNTVSCVRRSENAKFWRTCRGLKEKEQRRCRPTVPRLPAHTLMRGTRRHAVFMVEFMVTFMAPQPHAHMRIVVANKQKQLCRRHEQRSNASGGTCSRLGHRSRPGLRRLQHVSQRPALFQTPPPRPETAPCTCAARAATIPAAATGAKE